MSNKAAVFLGITLFSLIISTIVLATQKNNAKKDLDSCNADHEKPAEPKQSGRYLSDSDKAFLHEREEQILHSIFSYSPEK